MSYRLVCVTMLYFIPVIHNTQIVLLEVKYLCHVWRFESWRGRNLEALILMIEIGQEVRQPEIQAITGRGSMCLFVAQPNLFQFVKNYWFCNHSLLNVQTNLTGSSATHTHTHKHAHQRHTHMYVVVWRELMFWLKCYDYFTSYMLWNYFSYNLCIMFKGKNWIK